MRKLPILVAALCGSLAAQGTFTVPEGLGSIEGGASVSYPFSQYNAAGWHYQQSNGKLSQAYANVKSIAFRRDGNAATSTTNGKPRNLTLTVNLFHTNVANFSSTFASNYVGSATAVFTGAVNLPDWGPKPASAPAPFNVKIPFSTMWSYNGTDDFGWEIVETANSLNAYNYYPTDRQGGASTYYYASVATKLAAGCDTDTSGTSSLKFTAYPSFRVSTTTNASEIYSSIFRAPSNSAVSLIVGPADPDLALPGLCVNLRAVPSIVIPLGTVSSTGYLATQYVSTGPWQSSWSGVKLYAQALAPDATKTLPVALSTSREITLPSPGSAWKGKYTYEYSSTNATGRGPYTAGGVITQFEY